MDGLDDGSGTCRDTIATTLSAPQTTNWIADQADVKWDTAKRHLDSLVESGALLVTEDDRYVPDPTRAYFDHLRDLILTNDRVELRDELEAIAERIETWKTTYDVDSPADLEAALAAELPIEPKLLRRVHDRLSKTDGCVTVRYEPSSRDANEVVAEINPTTFLGRDYSSADARLRIEFDLTGHRPHYWIHWWEPDPGWGIGWHADETELEYGPVRLQIEHPDGTTERQAADHVDDEHPYRMFERRLTSIPGTLEQFGWE